VIHLRYFRELPEDLFIKNISTAGFGRWSVNFNKPVINPVISELSQSTDFIHEWNISHDSLYIWSADSTADSLSVLIRSGKNEADTATVRPARSKGATGGRGETRQRFIESSSSGTFTADTAFNVLFSFPVSDADTNRIQLLSDSVEMPYTVWFTDTLKRRMSFNARWQEDKNYKLIFLAGSITDFAGRKIDSTAIAFSPRSLRELGNIEINVSGLKDTSLLLQLVRDNNIVQSRRIGGDGVFTFEKIEPGPLKARIIFDSNRNGRWDTGSYFDKQDPEDVIYYPGEIQSRGNWEVEISWQVNDQDE
jgi:hypothetical protein